MLLSLLPSCLFMWVLGMQTQVRMLVLQVLLPIEPLPQFWFLLK